MDYVQEELSSRTVARQYYLDCNSMKKTESILAGFACGLVGYHEFQRLFISGKISEEMLSDMPVCIVDYLVAETSLNVLDQLELRDKLREWGYANRPTAKQFSKAKIEAFDRVKSRIISAFKDVALGSGMTLAQANAVDSYQSEEDQKLARQRDKNIAWQDYPLQDLEGFTALLYLDAEGFAFYIPAYLCWCVDKCLSDPFSNIASETFGAFDPELYGFERRVGALSTLQKIAVKEFLWLFAVHSDIYREACVSGLEALGPIDFETASLGQV